MSCKTQALWVASLVLRRSSFVFFFVFIFADVSRQVRSMRDPPLLQTRKAFSCHQLSDFEEKDISWRVHTPDICTYYACPHNIHTYISEKLIPSEEPSEQYTSIRISSPTWDVNTRRQLWPVNYHSRSFTLRTDLLQIIPSGIA